MPEWGRRRKSTPDDREWSAYTSVDPRLATRDLVQYSTLPAEPGPTCEPDRLSVWPVEGGRYGIDAHYHGPTGIERANRQLERLKRAGLTVTIRIDAVGWLVRLASWLTAPLGLPVRRFLGAHTLELM
jgi:hypothetical protein